MEIRELLATMLRRDGFDVDVAGDGASGWDAFGSKQYDLLITDNDMPILTGLELVRRLRAVPHMLPVIVISGFARWNDADVKALLQPGAFIEKPFAFPTLLGMVKELVGDKRAGSTDGAPGDGLILPLQPGHSSRHNGESAKIPAVEPISLGTTDSGKTA